MVGCRNEGYTALFIEQNPLKPTNQSEAHETSANNAEPRVRHVKAERQSTNSYGIPNDATRVGQPSSTHY